MKSYTQPLFHTVNYSPGLEVNPMLNYPPQIPLMHQIRRPTTEMLLRNCCGDFQTRPLSAAYLHSFEISVAIIHPGCADGITLRNRSALHNAARHSIRTDTAAITQYTAITAEDRAQGAHKHHIRINNCDYFICCNWRIGILQPVLQRPRCSCKYLWITILFSIKEMRQRLKLARFKLMRQKMDITN